MPPGDAEGIVDAIAELTLAIDAIRDDCVQRHVDPLHARTADGGYLLAPLLAARGQLLAAVTLYAAADLASGGGL
jgi:hypothetical protein